MCCSRDFFASAALSARKSPWISITQTWLYSSHLTLMASPPESSSCAANVLLLKFAELANAARVARQELAELLGANSQKCLGEQRIKLSAGAAADFREGHF